MKITFSSWKPSSSINMVHSAGNVLFIFIVFESIISTTVISFIELFLESRQEIISFACNWWSACVIKIQESVSIELIFAES